MAKYDYLVVGAGLFGATFADRASAKGKRVLVVDRRNHVAGNAYTENDGDIEVHKYGPHIFHTNDEMVWKYLNLYTDFNGYINSPVAIYNGKAYSLPFNMHTFSEMWGVTTPQEAQRIINDQASGIGTPANLEEQAIKLVGRDIYKTLVKGYTEKQWGRECRDLPPSIIKRLPVRFTYDNRYFDAKYQGIPEIGYTRLVNLMLIGCDVQLGVDYLENREELDALADKVIYTGALDEFYGYKYGCLEYRSLAFDTKRLATDNFQGNAVVNYTSHDHEYTRIVEHKWFDPKGQKGTVVTYEYSKPWSHGAEPFYPINDEKNNRLYAMYRSMADQEQRILFGGRLGDYRYYDMDAVIAKALALAERELE